MKKIITILLLAFSISSGKAQDTIKVKIDTSYRLYKGDYAKVISTEVVIKDTTKKTIIEAKRERKYKRLWRMTVVAWSALTLFGLLYSN